MVKFWKEKIRLGGARDIALPVPLIYSFNNLSMPFPALWLQVLKITLVNTNSADVLGFVQNPNSSIFPMIRDIVLTVVMDKR